MAARRRVRGDRSFRRLLKQMPDAIRTEMLDMLDKTGDEILAVQRGAAPVRTGAVRNALSKRLQTGLVRLRVGLVGKAVNRRLFYARIIEVGRKAKTVDVVRGGLAAAANVRAAGGRSKKYKALAVRMGTPGAYTLDVKPRAPHPFIVSPATNEIRNTMGGRLRGYWDRVLQKASAGASDA
jgi:hypothetical protein